VKDPTYLDPSLVMEVKFFSLTILHHIYSVIEGFYISHRFREIEGRNIEGFQQGGALVELVQFDLVKEKGLWRDHLLGYLGRGHSAFLGSSRRCFVGVFIYCVDGTVSSRGRAQLLK
jgi:hypothetical protein